MLGQLAGALEATHAAGGVHRDVKGSNIRVSTEGARAALMDFGAGTYAGAAPLTRQALPPGTGEKPVAAVESVALVRRQGSELGGRGASAERGSARGHAQAWAAYAACVLLGAVISAMAVGWGLWLGQQARGGQVAQPTLGKELPQHEPVGLGDTGLTAPAANVKTASNSGRLSRPVPQTPLKDQRRAPHCVPDVEATLHGGCWVEVPAVKPPCKDPLYEWQGSCYVPPFTRLRQPTSEPP